MLLECKSFFFFEHVETETRKNERQLGVIESREGKPSRLRLPLAQSLSKSRPQRQRHKQDRNSGFSDCLTAPT